MNRIVGLTLLLVTYGYFAAAQSADAAILSAGNLLVTDTSNSRVTEYTSSGSVVQTFNVVSPESFGLRDIVVDNFGSIQAFNGTFTPFLTTIDPVSGTQTDRATENFSTASVLGFGGIAATNNRVFVNDTDTFGSTGNGLISWEIGSGYTTTRFAQDFAASDLTVGQDGMLYALGVEDTVSAFPVRYVNVYSPVTLARTEQIDLLGSDAPAGLRALTADAAGNLYGIDFTDQIFKFDRAGNLLDTLTVTSSQNVDLADLDISANGLIAAASTNGEIFLTDTNFSSESSFDANVGGAFPNYYVAFTSPVTAIPEPGSVFAMLLLAGVIVYRVRTKHRKLSGARQTI